MNVYVVQKSSIILPNVHAGAGSLPARNALRALPRALSAARDSVISCLRSFTVEFAKPQECFAEVHVCRRVTVFAQNRPKARDLRELLLRVLSKKTYELGDKDFVVFWAEILFKTTHFSSGNLPNVLSSRYMLHNFFVVTQQFSIHS